MLKNTPKHGTYFKDGKRRADYVIVVDESSLKELRFYVRKLESLGLQLESVRGLTVNKIFLLIHIPQKALDHFSKIYDVGMEGRKVFSDEESHHGVCYNLLSTPISSIPDKEKGEFTSAERIMIINKVLESAKYGDDDGERGLTKLIRLKMVNDAYPLHDGRRISDSDNLEYANDRQLLSRYWANFSVWYKELPLDMIQKYFGCEIAFYFAWLQYFNLMLFPVAILGFLVFTFNSIRVTASRLNQIEEICEQKGMWICPACEFHTFCSYKEISLYCSFAKWTYIFDNYLEMAFAVLMSFWATLFINMWRRKENQLKLRWNVQVKDIEVEPRQEYLDSENRKEYIDVSGMMEPVIPTHVTVLRVTFTVSICFFMIFMVFATCLGIIIFKITFVGILSTSDVPYFYTHAKVLAVIVASLLQVVFIKLFGRIYGKLSIWLTNFENPRTQHDYDTSVLYKRYLLSFANNYTPLFYLAFVKGKLYTIPHDHYFVTHFEKDTCQPATCIVALCIQLAFIMLLKKFVGNILTLLLPCCVKCFKKIATKDDENESIPQYEREYKLTPTNRYLLTTEFSEMVIEYGFVTLFVAAFPLAPLCALLNNLLEARLDAYKLVARYRRPIPRNVHGIGSWDGVLLGVTYLSYATNALVIAFTSDFIGRELYRSKINHYLKGYVNSTLSTFATKDYHLYQGLEPNPEICYYRGMRHPPGHPQKYMLTTKYWVVVTWKLVCVLIFEHIIFLCNVILSYCIPDIPQSVKQRLDLDRQIAKHAKLKMLKQEMKASGDERKRLLEHIQNISFIRRPAYDSLIEVGTVLGFFEQDNPE